ncbi:MAG: peptide MFS transporter [Acidobacteriota bacterium]
MAQKHPKGLYTLFFTEMWERLGFYLMVGILYLYIIDTERGGLGMSNASAGEIYGTYLAFVYFTPFLGGMIADRYLGFRRSVFFGGILMAAGYFSLGVRSMPFFTLGLVLLCLGNGLFKPNISAMVGNLYEAGDSRRDAGFNIFYMGINIGASISALLAAPLRNLWSFNTAFIAAGVGLVIGTGILVLNWKKLAVADIQSEANGDDFGMKQIVTTILLPAGVFGAAGYFVGQKLPFVINTIGPVTFAFIVGMLPIVAYFGMLVKKASPEEKPGLAALIPVYIAGGAFFMILHLSGGLMTVFAENSTDRQAEWIPKATDFYAQKAMPSYFGNAGPGLARPDKQTLVIVDRETEAMFGARILTEAAVAGLIGDPDLTLGKVSTVSEDERFFENKVFADEQVKISSDKDAHGVTSTSVKVVPENASSRGSGVLTKTIDGNTVPVIPVSQETYDGVYRNTNADTPTLAPGRYVRLVNAEMITGLLNPVFVVLLTPVVVMFFAWRSKKGKPITTARKIFYGMVITAVSLLIMVVGAKFGQDGAIKTSMIWLAIYYLVITAGELCLSPMGLSLVTKLAPKRLVGLMMGGWFLSTSIGNKLSGFISGLEPTSQMFTILAVAILGVAAFLFALLPRLDSAIKKYGA